MIIRFSEKLFNKHWPSWPKSKKGEIKMKKAIVYFIGCLFTLALLTAVPLESANAWDIKKLIPGGGNKKGTSSKSVNMDDIRGEDSSIRRLVAKATASVLKGSAKVFSAVGKKEEAMKYKQAAEDLEKNPEDPQKIKDSMNLVDEGNESLGEIQAENTKVSAEGKKELGLGIIYVGAGGIVDTKAGSRAANFVNTLKSAIDAVQANPAKYGLGVMNTLKGSLDLMTSLSTQLPKQGTAINQTFSGLVKYASTNGVSVSMDDATKEAEKLEKG